MKYLSQITSFSLVLIVMGLLFLIGPAQSVLNVNAATYGYGYSTPTVSGGGGGGGRDANNHPALVTPTPNTRTLENVPATEEQTNTNTNGLTGAAVTGNTNITNYALGGIIGLVILGLIGLFLWKKYK